MIAETGGHDAETPNYDPPKCAVTIPKSSVTMDRNTQPYTCGIGRHRDFRAPFQEESE